MKDIEIEIKQKRANTTVTRKPRLIQKLITNLKR